MSRCIDNKIGNMLFAYELGLLNPDDDRLVELHILECEYCLRRAKRFTDSVNTIRDDVEARRVIQSEDAETERAEAGKAEKRRWPAIARTVAVAAAAVAILIFRPWQIEFRPSHDVFAEENRIAVMNFRNLAESTDSLQWGQVMSSLLTSDLSESRSLQVVSTQHLMDLTRDDQHPSTSPDKKRAMELAGEAGARWIVEGDILQLEPSPVVVARVVDSRSGTVKSSERINAGPGENLYAVVDPLTTRILASVLRPAMLPIDLDRPVAEVTTSSPKALQHYLEGLSLRAQFYRNEAVQQFEKSIACDSTFAMAYYYLALYRTGTEREQLLERAEAYAYKSGRKDKLVIASQIAMTKGEYGKGEELLLQIAKEFPQEKDAHYDLGNYYLSARRLEDARRHLTEAIKIDPGYKVAYNALAYVSAYSGDSSKAMWALDKYVEAAPDDANVYDSRGDIQIQFGMLEEAIQSYRKALAIKPDFYSSLRKLGDCFLVLRKYAAADSCYTAMLKAPAQDSFTKESIWLLALPALRQGDFQQAISILEKNSRLDSEPSASRYDVYYLKSLLLAELGRKSEAKIAVDSAVAIAEALQTNLSHSYVERIYLLAYIGDLPEADREYEKLKQSGLETEAAALHLPLAQAHIQFAKGNYYETKKLLGPVLGLTPSPSGRYFFPVRVLYARSCLLLGDAFTAASLLDSLVRKPAARRFYWSQLDIRNCYYLGLAYEKLGKPSEAISWFEQFIVFWDKSPQPIADVQVARERLARLRRPKI